MKKLTLAITLGLSLGLYACGGDSGGSSAANPASVSFTSPTGTLSADNADTVGDKVFTAFSGKDKVGVGFLQNKPQALLSHKATSASCVSNASETGGTIDYACITGFLSGCTGSGTLTYEISENVYSYTYDDVSISCSSLVFTNMNGTYSKDLSTGVYCSNVTFTSNNTQTIVSEGCYNTAGDIIIFSGDSSFVVTDLDADCSQATATITDAEGIATLTCTPEPDTCTTADDITGLSNCIVARTN